MISTRGTVVIVEIFLGRVLHHQTPQTVRQMISILKILKTTGRMTASDAFGDDVDVGVDESAVCVDGEVAVVLVT